MRYSIYVLLVFASPAFSGEPVYTWHSRADDPDRIYLYRDGKQIGGWCYRAKYYRPLDGETWGPPSEASPVRPPEQGSMVMSISRQSPPNRRLLRPIRSSVDAAMDQYVQANTARWVAEAVGEALKSVDWSVFDRLYLIDLGLSAKLFAHVEMGGKLDDNPDSDDYKLAKQLMASGSARVFLAEKAKFVVTMQTEKFSDPVLSTINLEIVDNEPSVLRKTDSQPETELRQVKLFRTRDWREDPPTKVASDTPSVLVITNHRAKDAKEAIPVIVYCSFTYMAMKDGKTSTKTLCFELYLEKLEPEDGGYQWKVRNVEYK
jgi:hypothetical protein